MKKSIAVLVIIVLGISLASCSIKPKDSAGELQKPQKTDTIQEKQKDTQKKTQPEGEKNNKPLTAKEKKKAIAVYVEGETEMRQATLTRSNELGYEFYLLENFGFTAEEPGKDIIYSKYDDSFFVRIEKLDKAVDLAKYKSEQIAAYKNIGKVTEISPSTIFLKGFQDANFYFITEVEDANGLKTSIKYVVKTFNGEKFAFTFFMPLKEAAEGITPSLWAMVDTLEVIK